MVHITALNLSLTWQHALPLLLLILPFLIGWGKKFRVRGSFSIGLHLSVQTKSELP